MEPGCIDADFRYNAQCMDLPIDYVLWLTDGQLRLWGNAKDAIHNTFPSDWKVIENKPSTVPKRGWIGVNKTTDSIYTNPPTLRNGAWFVFNHFPITWECIMNSIFCVPP